MAKTSVSIFEKHPKTTLLLIILGLAIAIDIVAAWLFIPTHDHDFRVPHPYFHHGLLPNQSQTTHWGPIAYPIATNSLGFRDATPRQVPLTSDKYRIVFMGDSHTEAVGVPFDKSFTGRLQSSIDTTRVEILNAAAVSYSPKLYYYKTKYLLEEVKLDFDELFVFLDISDIQNEYAYEEFNPSLIASQRIGPCIQRKLKQYSFLYYAIHKLYLEYQREKFYREISQELIDRNNTVDLYRTFFSHFHNEVLLNNPEFHTTISEWYSDESLYRRWGKQGIELMTIYMQKLADLCHRHRIPLTITVHPWRTQVRKGEVEDRHTQYWRSFAQKNDLRFISLYPLFVNELPAEEVIQANYIPDDNHWTTSGHQLVADKLFSFLALPAQDSNWFTIPKNSYHYHRSIVLQEAGKLDSALYSLSQAIKINPNQANYYYQRGQMQLAKNNFQSATEDFQQAFSLDSTHRKARLSNDLIPAYQSLHRTTQWLEDSVTDDGYIQRGKALMQLGRYPRAYEDFDQAQKLAPQNKVPYFYLGYIKQEAMGSPRESIPYYNRAIALDSAYIEAYRQRAKAFSSIGAAERATKDLNQVKQLNNSQQNSK